MFDRTFTTCAAIVFASTALAETLPPNPDDYVSPQLSVIDVGIICAQEIVGLNDAPGTVAGSTNIIEGEPDFISSERFVPAVLGVGFGVKSQAQSVLGIDSVTMTVTHPPMGADGTTVQVYGTAISGRGTSLTFYQFDYNYELVLGHWQMEASVDGEVIYRVGFDVVEPDAMPQLANACGFEDLLS
jgi:hypothetical protein